jgi:hypothetical protein
MPEYHFIVWTDRSRVKCPENFYLPDVEAARRVATRLAWVFGEIVPQWDELTYEQQYNVAVEVVDEAGHTLLAVPFREAEELTSH